MKQQFIVKPDNERWRNVVQLVVAAINEAVMTGTPVMVTLGELKRTLDQNAAMWATLRDFVAYVPWMVTDAGGKQVLADTADMKDILTAAFEQETRMAPGLRGGVVMLGARTSKYGKRKMGEFLTFVHAEGTERGVVWSKKATDDLEFYTMGRA